MVGGTFSLIFLVDFEAMFRRAWGIGGGGGTLPLSLVHLYSETAGPPDHRFLLLRLRFIVVGWFSRSATGSSGADGSSAAGLLV